MRFGEEEEKNPSAVVEQQQPMLMYSTKLGGEVITEAIRLRYEFFLHYFIFRNNILVVAMNMNTKHPES